LAYHLISVWVRNEMNRMRTQEELRTYEESENVLFRALGKRTVSKESPEKRGKKRKVMFKRAGR